MLCTKQVIGELSSSCKNRQKMSDVQVQNALDGS